MLLDLGEALKRQGESRPFSLVDTLPDTLLVGGVHLAGPVKVLGSVTAMGHRLAVVGQITARIKAPCALCLRQAAADIRCDLNVLLVRSGYAAQGEENRDEDEAQDAVEFEGTSCDLMPSVVETLNLHIPMRLLCREDCRGLCPQCGKNLNDGPCMCGRDSDSPFAGLKVLFNNKEE